MAKIGPYLVPISDKCTYFFQSAQKKKIKSFFVLWHDKTKSLCVHHLLEIRHVDNVSSAFLTLSNCLYHLLLFLDFCGSYYSFFFLLGWGCSAAKLVLFIRLLVLLKLFEKFWSYFGLIFEGWSYFYNFVPCNFSISESSLCISKW